jgi:hypothetical protein
MRAHARPAVLSELIRRFHTGRWPVFRRLIAVHRVGAELVELAEWRTGGYAVVFWSLREDSLRWLDYENKEAAYAEFERLGQAATAECLQSTSSLWRDDL